MTVIVGVRCTDGVVIGADSAATSAAGQIPLLSVPLADKIQIIADRVICANTGPLGLGQRACEAIRAAHDKKCFQKSAIECCKEISADVLKDFQSTFVRLHPQHGLGFGTLLAAPFGDQHGLVEFGTNDYQPEIKQELFFASMGSGQTLADPFLAFVSRVLWNHEAPDIEQAMFGVLWALIHAVAYAPGGVGDPITLAVLQRVKGQWRARKLDAAEQQEQREHIDEIEARIRQDPQRVITEGPVSEPPKPSEKGE